MTSVCICGAGTMGSGIAQVTAAAGFDTTVYDLSGDMISRAREKMDRDLEQLVTKQKITAEKKQEILGRLRFTSSIQDCRADLVIEAIVEKSEIKKNLFEQLAAINTADTIFASNTSSLSISSIAEGFIHPDRVAGLHFFNPATLMKLVEVVKGKQTAASVIEQLTDFTRKLGKEPVVCTDSPGFIVNRVARPFYIESLRLAEDGHQMTVIDRLLENRGFKMGPFRLMDLIGNDVNYAVSCSVYEQLGKPERLRPSYIQQEKVEKGQLGKKTGSGYYTY
ncbi:MAG TPA: 3-hydroxyacyl-CoA dehydrogenase NAD-binding domain-containing protein [Flavisolibacter sp.]|nr:3-hydroxyacyl-CoA dehydrogenase NAD-binding domain-containing protein [Flavisolibacter sp.]